MRKLSSWYTSRPIAHRGLHGHGLGLENSYEAFVAAIDQGHPIECDIHLTQDNELVVHHDGDTARLTDRKKIIEKSDYQDLKKLKLQGSKYPILHLQDLLELCDDRVPLLIELKATQQVKRMARAIKKNMDCYDGDYAIQSFDPFILIGLRMSMPGEILGLLSGTFEDYELPPYQHKILRELMLVPVIKPDFIAVEWVRGDEKKLQTLRETYPLLGWTVDDKSDLAFCHKYFDNIIFENLSCEQMRSL